MRVCYNIHSHRGAAQLRHLVSTITTGSPDSVVVISHDRHGEPIDVADLRSLGDVTVQFARGGYGDFTHVDRYFDAVDWLRRSGTRVDWLVNLAGTHYPLKPLPVIESELADSGADGFLQYFPAFGPGHHWPPRRARTRYLFRHRRLASLPERWQRRLRPVQVVNLLQPLLRVQVAYGLTVGRRVRSPFGPNLRLYGGSSFMSLSWPVVEYLWWFRNHRPELVEHFRRTLSPEEAFFATALLHTDQFTYVNDKLRYFRFAHGGLNRSRTLGAADVDAALASGAHFGGKFDLAADPAVIARIDHVVRRPPDRPTVG